MESRDDANPSHFVPPQSQHKLKVPGYGLAIDYELAPSARFRHGAVDMDFDRMTVRELSILGLIEALTDKPDWHKKIFDQAILDKWRTEALAMPMISENTWDWCLNELQDKAKDFEATQLTTVLDMGSRCVKTDSIVPGDLRDALKAGVKPLLERTPQDWHPGSNDQILDLLHPSLYPAIYGKTRILPSDELQLDACLLPHNHCVVLRDDDFNDPEETEEVSTGADVDEDNGDGDRDNDDNNNLAEGNAFPQHSTNEESQAFEEFAPFSEFELPTQGEQEAVTETMDAQQLADYEAQLALLNAGNMSRLARARAEGFGVLGGSEDFEGTANAGQFIFEVPDFDPKEREVSNDDCWSHKFQWLPCDVSFTDDTGTSVTITSYINNLHPNEHRPLYHIVESFISLSIPAWNQILVTGNKGRTPLRIKINDAPTDPPEPPTWADNFDRSDEGVTDQMFEKTRAKVMEYWELPDNPINEPWFEDIDEDWEDYLNTGLEWKWKRLRKVIHPEPGVSPSSSYEDWKAGRLTDTSGTTTTFTYSPVKIENTFRKTGIQVIVKLASIELTPEKPSYAGGSWHLEGMLNEHIVATSIYYFDVENITESRIRFRQEAWLDSAELLYPQYDHAPLCQVFGVDSLSDEPMIQEIGSMATHDGRFLAFPNTLQHKVEPFNLADPTKPGHRRFLVLWLVDPNYRILSTANVPPQQHEWWVGKAAEKVSGRVSREIQMMIEEQMKDGTLTLEEAKAYRLELMAERTTFADTVQAAVREYDFCEH